MSLKTKSAAAAATITTTTITWPDGYRFGLGNKHEQRTKIYLIYHTSNRAKRNSLVNLTIKEFHFFPLSTLWKDRPPSLPFIKTRQFHGTEIFKRNVLCAYFHFPHIVKHLSIALISRESGFVGKVNVVTAFWKRILLLFFFLLLLLLCSRN